MIDIYVRHINDCKPTYLMSWPSQDLDSVIPTLSAWVLSYEAEEYREEAMMGRFVVADGKGYFEVLLED